MSSFQRIGDWNKEILLHTYTLVPLIDRLSIMGDTPLLVMCGALGLSCMKYGVLDEGLLQNSRTLR